MAVEEQSGSVPCDIAIDESLHAINEFNKKKGLRCSLADRVIPHDPLQPLPISPGLLNHPSLRNEASYAIHPQQAPTLYT